MGLEGVFHRPVDLVTLGDFADRSDDHLSRKTESLPNLVVEDLLESDLPKRSVRPCYVGDVVTALTPALFRRTGQTILTVVAPFTTIRFISLFYAQVAKV